MLVPLSGTRDTRVSKTEKSLPWWCLHSSRNYSRKKTINEKSYNILKGGKYYREKQRGKERIVRWEEGQF